MSSFPPQFSAHWASATIGQRCQRGGSLLDLSAAGFHFHAKLRNFAPPKKEELSFCPRILAAKELLQDPNGAPWRPPPSSLCPSPGRKLKSSIREIAAKVLITTRRTGKKSIWSITENWPLGGPLTGTPNMASILASNKAFNHNLAKTASSRHILLYEN